MDFGFLAALRAMSRKEIIYPLLWSILVALGVLGLCVWGVQNATESFLASLTPPEWLPDWGIEPLGVLMHLGATIATVFAWILSFRTLVHATLGLLLEMTLERLVARDPTLPSLLPGPSSMRSLGTSVVSLLKWFCVHLMLSPLYLLSSFFPPLSLALFFAVDGRMLSGEMYELVSPRLVPEDERDSLRNAMRRAMQVWGTLVSVLLVIPVVNLAVPLFAMVSMVYFVQAYRIRIQENG